MYEQQELIAEYITSPTKDCVICGAPSTQFHYNAQACTLCAIFFRTIVLTDPRLEFCARVTRCRVSYEMSSICRACRYQKCVKMGMDGSMVKRPDRNDRKKMIPRRVNRRYVPSTAKVTVAKTVPIEQVTVEQYLEMKRPTNQPPGQSNKLRWPVPSAAKVTVANTGNCPKIPDCTKPGAVPLQEITVKHYLATKRPANQPPGRCNKLSRKSMVQNDPPPSLEVQESIPSTEETEQEAPPPLSPQTRYVPVKMVPVEEVIFAPILVPYSEEVTIEHAPLSSLEVHHAPDPSTEEISVEPEVHDVQNCPYLAPEVQVQESVVSLERSHSAMQWNPAPSTEEMTVQPEVHQVLESVVSQERSSLILAPTLIPYSDEVTIEHYPDTCSFLEVRHDSDPSTDPSTQVTTVEAGVHDVQNYSSLTSEVQIVQESVVSPEHHFSSTEEVTVEHAPTYSSLEVHQVQSCPLPTKQVQRTVVCSERNQPTLGPNGAPPSAEEITVEVASPEVHHVQSCSPPATEVQESAVSSERNQPTLGPNPAPSTKENTEITVEAAPTACSSPGEHQNSTPQTSEDVSPIRNQSTLPASEIASGIEQKVVFSGKQDASVSPEQSQTPLEQNHVSSTEENAEITVETAPPACSSPPEHNNSSPPTSEVQKSYVSPIRKSQAHLEQNHVPSTQKSAVESAPSSSSDEAHQAKRLLPPRSAVQERIITRKRNHSASSLNTVYIQKYTYKKEIEHAPPPLSSSQLGFCYIFSSADFVSTIEHEEQRVNSISTQTSQPPNLDPTTEDTTVEHVTPTCSTREEQRVQSISTQTSKLPNLDPTTEDPTVEHVTPTCSTREEQRVQSISTQTSKLPNLDPTTEDPTVEHVTPTCSTREEQRVQSISTQTSLPPNHDPTTEDTIVEHVTPTCSTREEQRVQSISTQTSLPPNHDPTTEDTTVEHVTSTCSTREEQRVQSISTQTSQPPNLDPTTEDTTVEHVTPTCSTREEQRVQSISTQTSLPPNHDPTTEDTIVEHVTPTCSTREEQRVQSISTQTSQPPNLDPTTEDTTVEHVTPTCSTREEQRVQSISTQTSRLEESVVSLIPVPATEKVTIGNGPAPSLALQVHHDPDPSTKEITVEHAPTCFSPEVHQVQSSSPPTTQVQETVVCPERNQPTLGFNHAPSTEEMTVEDASREGIVSPERNQSSSSLNPVPTPKEVTIENAPAPSLAPLVHLDSDPSTEEITVEHDLTCSSPGVHKVQIVSPATTQVQETVVYSERNQLTLGPNLAPSTEEVIVEDASPEAYQSCSPPASEVQKGVPAAEEVAIEKAPAPSLALLVHHDPDPSAEQTTVEHFSPTCSSPEKHQTSSPPTSEVLKNVVSSECDQSTLRPHPVPSTQKTTVEPLVHQVQSSSSPTSSWKKSVMSPEWWLKPITQRTPPAYSSPESHYVNSGGLTTPQWIHDFSWPTPVPHAEEMTVESSPLLSMASQVHHDPDPSGEETTGEHVPPTCSSPEVHHDPDPSTQESTVEPGVHKVQVQESVVSSVCSQSTLEPNLVPSTQETTVEPEVRRVQSSPSCAPPAEQSYPEGNHLQSSSRPPVPAYQENVVSSEYDQSTLGPNLVRSTIKMTVGQAPAVPPQALQSSAENTVQCAPPACSSLEGNHLQSSSRRPVPACQENVVSSEWNHSTLGPNLVPSTQKTTVEWNQSTGNVPFPSFERDHVPNAWPPMFPQWNQFAPWLHPVPYAPPAYPYPGLHYMYSDGFISPHWNQFASWSNPVQANFTSGENHAQSSHPTNTEVQDRAVYMDLSNMTKTTNLHEQGQVPDKSAPEERFGDSSSVQKLCAVCGRPSIQLFYNVQSCGRCATFFSMTSLTNQHLVCDFENRCHVDHETSSPCAACRHKKCLEVGMKRDFDSVNLPQQKPCKQTISSNPVHVSTREVITQESSQPTCLFPEVRIERTANELPPQKLNGQSMATPISSLKKITVERSPDCSSSAVQVERTANDPIGLPPTLSHHSMANPISSSEKITVEHVPACSSFEVPMECNDNDPIGPPPPLNRQWMSNFVTTLEYSSPPRISLEEPMERTTDNEPLDLPPPLNRHSMANPISSSEKITVERSPDCSSFEVPTERTANKLLSQKLGHQSMANPISSSEKITVEHVPACSSSEVPIERSDNESLDPPPALSLQWMAMFVTTLEHSSPPRLSLEEPMQRTAHKPLNLPPTSSLERMETLGCSSSFEEQQSSIVYPELNDNSFRIQAEKLLNDLVQEEKLAMERRKLFFCSKNSALADLLTSEITTDIPSSLSNLQPLTLRGIQNDIRSHIFVIHEWLRAWRHFGLLNANGRLLFLRRCVLYQTILDSCYLSHRRGLPYKFIMFNGMYVGVLPGDKTGWEDEKMKLYRPLMDRLINEVCIPMHSISLSFEEFVILKSLVSFKLLPGCDVTIDLKKLVDGYTDFISRVLTWHYMKLGTSKRDVDYRTEAVTLIIKNIVTIGLECIKSHQQAPVFGSGQLEDLLIYMNQMENVSVS